MFPFGDQDRLHTGTCYVKYRHRWSFAWRSAGDLLRAAAISQIRVGSLILLRDLQLLEPRFEPSVGLLQESVRAPVPLMTVKIGLPHRSVVSAVEGGAGRPLG